MRRLGPRPLARCGGARSEVDSAIKAMVRVIAFWSLGLSMTKYEVTRPDLNLSSSVASRKRRDSEGANP